MGEHNESTLVVTNQKRFEAYLEDTNSDACRYYLNLKAEARRNGEDPMIYLLKRIAGRQPEKAEKLRAICISKRLLDPTDYDISMLKTELIKQGYDLDTLSDIIRDRRKLADLVVAFNIDRFKDLGRTGVYIVVDKILEEKTAKGIENRPPVNIIDVVPFPETGENGIALALLERYDREERLEQFQKDFNSAEKELETKIAETANPAKAAILRRTLEYYRDLKNYHPTGIVDSTIDEETSQVVLFPALHQKIAGRFIVEEKKVLIADAVGLGKTAEAIIAKNMIEERTGRKITAVAVVPNEVVSQWEEQINKWNTQKKNIVVIRSENKADSITKIEHKKPDFVIVSYDMIFRKINGSEETIGQMLAKISEYAIFDEVDEARSEHALRTKEMLHVAEKSQYVAMLSATPLPNSLDDAAVIWYIISNGEVDIRNLKRRLNKETRRSRIHISSKMLRRTNAEVYGLRNANVEINNIELTKEQMLAHERILINEAGKGSLALIDAIRRCCMDPHLAGIDQESPKYRLAAEIIKRHIDKAVSEGDEKIKAVTYTCDLQEGVTEQVSRYLNANAIASVRIDGQIQGSNRQYALEEFKKGGARNLVATLKTMGKGVELREGNVVIFLNPPLTGAELEQGIGRLARKGQKREVYAYILVGKNSAEERILIVARQKEKLQQFLVDGIELTEEEMKRLSTPTGIAKGTKNPLDVLYRIFGNITNRNSKNIEEILKDEQIAAFIAEKYWDNFEGSYFGNTNRLVAHVIDELAKSGIKIDSIVDIASGPGCLARVLQKPVVCVDINHRALALAREKLGDLAKPVCASFCALPFAKESFDVEVLSLALLHSVASEREAIIRQLNHTTKKGGVIVITLPNSYVGYERMIEGIKKLGLEVLGGLTGVAKSPGTNFECFVITLVKTADAPEERVEPSYFDLKRTIEEIGHQGREFGHLKGVYCEKFVIERQSIEVAAQSAAKEKRTLLDIPTYEDLVGRYGSITKIPKEELGRLGLEVVSIGRGNNKGYQIVPKVDKEMEDKGKKVGREISRKINGPENKGKVKT